MKETRMEKDNTLSLESAEDRFMRLYRERSALLSLPPEQALKRILEAPQPAALLHSFSEEDFYFLVQEIGPEDALELLSLASDRQWDFLLDMESWTRERFDSPALTRWIDLLMKADPQRLTRWILEAKTDFFEFYLFKNLELRIREHDEDPSAFGEGFMTLDDLLYFRCIEYPFDRPLTDPEKETRDEVVFRLLKNLSNSDYPLYQKLVLEAASVIPAESEEELYRLRNVRMAEKGILPAHEAVGIYQAIKPEKIRKAGGKFVSGRIADLLLPVPVGFSRTLEKDSAFTRALEVLEAEGTLFQIQTEFASLCNRILSADQKILRDREALRGVVKKACGFLSIGLERLSPEKGSLDPGQNAAMLARYSLEDLFRVGFGAAQELKWRAEEWQKKAWYVSEGLSLTFWAEGGLGVLGGLLIQRPLFFDNYQSGVLYREFASLAEVEETGRALERILALDALFSRLNIDAAAFVGRPFFTYKNCLLTFWARQHLGLDSGDNAETAPVIPLTLAEFRRFFPMLWEGKKRKRRIRLDMKESFLKWLGERSGLPEDEIRQHAGPGLEVLFEELEGEYREVAPENLDPRYLPLFLVENSEQEIEPRQP